MESAAGGRAGSLLDEIDRTVTPMGGRLLRTWLLRPLTALEAIRDRLDAVEELAVRTTDRGKARETLKSIQDLERLISRIALSTAGPRDLMALSRSLAAVPRLALLLSECQAPLVRSLCGELDDLADLREWIDRAIADEPPALAREGGFVRDGFDKEVDDLRHISRSGKQVIAEMEDGERTRTGIASLKVRFNRVFGYYIEISKSNLHAVPQDYIRKQTIAGGERFITPGAEGIRRESPRRRRAHRHARARDFRVACGSAWRPRRRACSIPRAPWPASTCSAAWRKRRRPATTPSRTCTTATRFPPPTCAIPWSNAWPAARSCPTTSCSMRPRTSW